MKKLIRITAFFLSLIVFYVYSVPVKADAFTEYLVNAGVYVNGEDKGTLKCLDLYYVNNTYISLRDMAWFLSDTDKKYNVDVTASSVTVTTGAEYEKKEGDGVGFEEDEDGNLGTLSTDPLRNSFTYDDSIRKYVTIILQDSDGNYDCFMNMSDFALLFDMEMSWDDNVLSVNTDNSFFIDIDYISSLGQFDEIDSALVGDVLTGEILYSSDEDEKVAIASTTKLMTYLVVMNEISDGNITFDDMVTISGEAETLSYCQDGVIRLTEGDEVSVEDLIKAMLLPSSNECALALAQYVGGTEEDFVELMNITAKEIGMSEETVFYNCNGLPSFTDDVLMTKHQNYSTASDMFILVSYILGVYPQIQDITGSRALNISGLDMTVYNTNNLLYNLPGTTGLKTGTTNRAGCCLICSYPVEINGETHTIVSFEFGGEDSQMRENLSMVLLRYGIQTIEGKTSGESAEGEAKMPETLEGMACYLINMRK